MSRRDGVAIVWFRQDLRLSDNPALSAACSECSHILPIFIDDPTAQTVSRVGAASRVWLHSSLQSLQQQLKPRGYELLLLQGEAQSVLQQLLETMACKTVCIYWNRCYDPVSKKRDERIKSSLCTSARIKSFKGLLAFEPWETRKADGTPYRVFTPFYRNLAAHLGELKPLAAPRSWPAPAVANVPGRLLVNLQKTGLLPAPHAATDWAVGIMQHWQPGELAARKRLRQFIAATVADYGYTRNIPSLDGTSRMSPHLHFGEISPRQIIAQLFRYCGDVAEPGSGAEILVREVLWREFAYQLLFHFPHMVTQPLDARFETFPWERASKKIRRAWESGQTGVPIVDAGMRQLWQTGWMHNRVRMIVGSYLVKNLLLDWRHGEKWFRDTLLDADMASNTMGWQWVAGCGADAAPFFRVFNPVLQGEKFDPDGLYVRRWVPELVNLPDSHIHKPWDLPLEQRPKAYPAPLVDLKSSRTRALLRFDQIKRPA